MTEEKRALRRSLCLFGALLVASSCTLHRDTSPVAIAEEQKSALTGPVVVDPGPVAVDESVPGEEPGKDFAVAVTLKRNGKDDDAAQKLNEVVFRHPGTVWAARASLLLGISELEAHRDGLTFFEAASGVPDIEDYIVYYRGRALLEKKDFAGAAEAFDSIPTLFPDSRLIEDSSFRKASALLETGAHIEALAAFSEFMEAYPGSPLVPEAILGSARANIGLGYPGKSAPMLMRIRYRYPLSRPAATASALLADLRDSGLDMPGPTDEDIYARAGALFDGARYREAIDEYSRLRVPGNAYFDRAVMKTAYGQVRLKNYSLSETTLKEYLKGRKPEKVREALSLLALVSLRRGDIEGLLDVEKRLAERGPTSPERASALFYIGTYHEGKGENHKAVEYYKKASVIEGTESAKDALWALGWLDYREGDFEGASTTLTEYAVLSTGRDLAKALYWKARSLDKAGRTDEAAEAYRETCARDTDGYYCRLSSNRVSGLKGRLNVALVGAETADATAVTPSAPLEPDDEPIEDKEAEGFENMATGEVIPEEDSLRRDPHFLAARELMTLGLVESASAEIELLARRFSGETGALTTLASLFHEAGDYYRSHRLYRRFLSETLKDDDSLASYSYPLKLVGLIKERAPYAADPFLVAAVIREESHFNPRATSPAGALGLMQLMPDTARAVSIHAGNGDFTPADLFDPSVNIELGSRYLSSLLKRFDNDVVLAVAGYNAGPEAVSKWALSLPSEYDEFIESIPYRETRNYAKKVLRSYGEYMRLSGEDPSELFRNPRLTLIRKNSAGI
ncbi:MAG: transglycosylase SLT domain-containing protein [Deltaproteobacteria bacterium]|nr:transglycosylase SLT domain-containing protein [Deltaproteobacteria bacterium]